MDLTRFTFVVRRLGTGLLQLLALSVIVFFVIRMMPADPVANLVGLNATPETYSAARHAMGLDRPIYVQLATYLGLQGGHGLLQGHLGTSWSSGGQVLEELLRALPVTLEFITLSFLLAFLVAFPIGMLCATRPGSVADRGTFLFSLFAGSQPEFWWGVLFVYVFFFLLNVAPPPLGQLSPMLDAPPFVTGSILIDSVIAGNLDTFSDGLAHLALPVLTKVFVLSGPMIRMIRQNMLRVLSSDYILYAESCGLPPGRIARYALRNALAPALTLIGVLYGYVIGGAVLLETIFSLGGLGQYSVRAVLALDYPAIQGVVLMITAVSLIIYLLLDLAQGLLDPRMAR